MKFFSPVMDGSVNVGTLLVVAVLSIGKVITPYFDSNDIPVVQQEIQNMEVVSEFYEEDVPKKSFEEEHSDKPYIFLEYSTDIEVREDGSYLTTSYRKIKVQKDGYKSLGTIPIKYIQGRDKIISIEGSTIVQGGEKYSYSDIQDRAIYRGYKNYSDLREKVITLPKVTAGAILEYKVVKESKGKIINNEFWYTSGFGFSAPTKYERFTISLPKSLNVNYQDINIQKNPEIKEDEQKVVYTWEFENEYESYEEEGYSPFPTIVNMKNIFQFSSIKNWSEISDWYYDLTANKVIVTEDIKKQAELIFEGKNKTGAKVLALLEYFNKNFRYISMSFNENTFDPHSTKDVFDNKYGDCKDTALLFKTMLEIGGVKSNLALFVEEEIASNPKYDLPMPGMFNHVILYIEDPDEGNFYLDPLIEGYYLEEYPLEFQGAYIFIIDDKGGRFDKLPIFDEKRIYRRKIGRYIINKDGSREFEVENIWNLDVSISMRKKVKNMSKEELIESMISMDQSYTEVLDRDWEGFKDKYGPIKSYLKARDENYFDVSGEIIILYLEAFDGPKNYDELYRETDYFYPYNSLEEEKTTYVIPEDYEVAYLPKDLKLEIDFFSFSREFNVNQKGEIVIHEQDRRKRATVSKERQDELKGFFLDLSEKSEQRIILRKKKSYLEDLQEFLVKTGKRIF